MKALITGIIFGEIKNAKKSVILRQCLNHLCRETCHFTLLFSIRHSNPNCKTFQQIFTSLNLWGEKSNV